MGTGMMCLAKRILLFFPLLSPCLAQPPVLQQLDPPGGQLGQALVLKLVGRSLPAAANIITPLPATFTPMTPAKTSSGEPGSQELAYLVELGSDASLGLYPIRVSSPAGLSNILLFSVGAFPEVREEESLLSAHEAVNDSPAAAQLLKRIPVTVNGRLHGPERDLYRIEGRKGDSLVFEVEARRAGSAVDPLILLLDSREREIAFNDDAPGLGVDSRLDVRLPQDGSYYVVIHDSRFSEQTENFYRLKIGSFSYAEALFPLGGRRGSRVDVELLGGNLGEPANLTLDLVDVASDRFIQVPIPGSPGALPMLFAVGDLEEVVVPGDAHPSELREGTVVNGRISRPGEVDRFKLDVAPGEIWAVDLAAAELGTSRLSGLVMVHDEKGERLASAGDDSPSAGVERVIPRGLTSSDPHLNFTAPEGVTRVLISVEDLVSRGGPDFGYRLEARREPPDFTLVLEQPFVNAPAAGTTRVAVRVNRRGYRGGIRLGVSGDTDGLLVRGGDVSPDSRPFAHHSEDVGVLTISAGSDAVPGIRKLVVWGESVSEQGPVIRRRALAPGLITNVLVGTGRSAAATVRDVQKPFTAPWLETDLPLMITKKLPARVVLESAPRIRLIQGGAKTLKWRLESEGPAVTYPELISLEAGGRGIQLRLLDEQGRLLPPGEVEKPGFREGDLRVRTTEGTGLGRFNLLMHAEIKVGDEILRLFSQAIRVEVIQGYEIEVFAGVSLRPGGEARLEGRVSRSEGFSEGVDIHVENLPPGVNCAQVHVDAGEDRFDILCEALDSSFPGEYEVELISSSVLPYHEKESVPYNIPPVQARLTVEDHRRAEGRGPGS